MGQDKESLRESKALGFYMFAFLLDGICAQYTFLGMYWYWTPHNKFLVYFQCRVFSKSRFWSAYNRLAEHLFSFIFHMIYEIDPPYMTNQVKESMQDIVDWFTTPEGTYIRCFGCRVSPHFMPQYVTNKVVLQEVAYQLDKGFSRVLHRRKKYPWPTFP